MEELRITTEEDQIVNVFLKPNTEVYKRRKYELVASGMNDDEADDYLSTTPIQLELFYSESQGLWGVESEALDNCEIYNPYSGKEVPNDNLIYLNGELRFNSSN